MECPGLSLLSTALVLWVASCHTLAMEGPPTPVPTPINSTDDKQVPPTPLNSTDPAPTLASNIYEDWTDFVVGVNGWDFMGMWGKYDLLELKEEDRPLPLIPDAKDQSIFMCLVRRDWGRGRTVSLWDILG